ncbi:hypothetical protein EV401DRAFT_2006576 [Pisolithus croceorrhizus]|nr:hypothetical protein EV401DRAFT_2006576 [Pisolithus croceorrhizus]
MTSPLVTTGARLATLPVRLLASVATIKGHIGRYKDDITRSRSFSGSTTRASGVGKWQRTQKLLDTPGSHVNRTNMNLLYADE